MLLLERQGLTALRSQSKKRPSGKPAGRRKPTKADVLAAIRRMGLLQIDTISVVARSPYLVLYSRLGTYEPRWLDELLAEGALFEYWAHAACFIPAVDYALFASLIAHGTPSYSDRVQEWLASHVPDTTHVLARIRTEGRLRRADFVAAQKPAGGWWNWKAEKLALEHLFLAGELMVARREGFQRVYDLRERVRPDWEPRQGLEPAEVYAALVERAALALGAATEPWLRDYYRLKRDACRAAIATPLERGVLLEARIEGHYAPAYVHRDVEAARASGAAGISGGPAARASRTALLSPFDPVVWDRARARALFDFDYTIEVYTPEAKRRYGYFVLPILHGGRLCPKAHRREGVFEMRALHLERGVKLDDAD